MVPESRQQHLSRWERLGEGFRQRPKKETSAPVTVAKGGRGSSEVNKASLALLCRNVKQNLFKLDSEIAWI
jgi:hypothetical protein